MYFFLAAHRNVETDWKLAEMVIIIYKLNRNEDKLYKLSWLVDIEVFLELCQNFKIFAIAPQFWILEQNLFHKFEISRRLQENLYIRQSTEFIEFFFIVIQSVNKYDHFCQFSVSFNIPVSS